MGDPTPQDIEYIEHEGYLEARFLGDYQLARFKSQVTQSSMACPERGFERLLVDISGMKSYSSASVTDRFEIGIHAAKVARSLARIAVFGTQEQMDPEAFGAVVAQNRGVRVEVFIDRDKALAWITAPLTK